MNGEELPADPEITIDARRFAGVWANAVQVTAEEAEFTIDLIRMDPRRPRGMVVARVTGSPRFLRDLMDSLEAAWHDWMWRSTPPEERGDGV